METQIELNENQRINQRFQAGMELYRYGFGDEARVQFKEAADRADLRDSDWMAWLWTAQEAWAPADEIFNRIRELKPDWYEPALRQAEIRIGLFDSNGGAIFDAAARLGAPLALLHPVQIEMLFRFEKFDEAENLIRNSQDLSDLERWIFAEKLKTERWIAGHSRTWLFLRFWLWIAKIIHMAWLRDTSGMFNFSRFLAHAFPQKLFPVKWIQHLASISLDVRRLTFQDERNAIRKLIQLAPLSSRGYFDLAASHLHACDWEHAESILRNAMSKINRHPELLWLLGNSLCGQNKYSEAISVYEEAARGIQNDNLTINRVAALILENRHAEARRECDRHIKKAIASPIAKAIDAILSDEGIPAEIYARRMPWDRFSWIHNDGLRPWDRYLAARRKLEWKTQIERLKRLMSPIHFDPCPNCGNSDIRLFRLVHLNEFTRARVTVCQRCSFVAVNPSLSQTTIDGFYTAPYFEFDRERAEWFKTINDRLYTSFNYYPRLFEWLDSMHFARYEASCGPGRRAIDFGCSTGVMMLALKNRGWTAAGVDVSQTAIEYVKGNGFEGYCGTPETLDLPDAAYDFAVLAHVIEHVPAPMKLLSLIRKTLKKNALMLLITPVCHTPTADFTGSIWFYDPAHLYFFNRTVLLDAIRRCGFELYAARLPVGIRFETCPYRWRKELIGPAVERVLSEHDMGDLIWVLARAR